MNSQSRSLLAKALPYAFALVLALVLAGTASAQVERGQRLVVKHSRAVALYMYPGSTFRSLDTNGTLQTFADGSFRLTYKFHFEWQQQTYWATMNFQFSRDGALQFTSNGTHNTTYGPGTVAEGAVYLLRAGLEALLGEPPGSLRQYSPTARGLLEWYLQTYE